MEKIEDTQSITEEKEEKDLEVQKQPENKPEDPITDTKLQENETKDKNDEPKVGIKRKASEIDKEDEDNKICVTPEHSGEKDDSSANDSPSEINLPPKQTLGKGKRARIPNKRYSDIMLSPTIKPLRPVLPPAVENGGDDNKAEIELEHTSDSEILPVPVNPNKKTKVVVDVKNPKYLKPFEYGWKRELVYRATINESMKRDGDIYYYTPAGKKMRSMREVSDNLKTKELTIDNFTFFKEPLGLNDPEKEIIRDAKKKSSSGKVAAKRNPARTATPGGDTPKSNKNVSGNIKVKLPTKAKIDKKKPDEVELKRTPARKSTRTSASMERELNGKPCQPCSIRCEGVLGSVPTLQCRICLCLYHHECVGLSSSSFIDAYICKNCQLEHGQVTSAAVNTTAMPGSLALPPLTPINALKSMTTQSTVLPKLQRIPRANESPPVSAPTPPPPPLIQSPAATAVRTPSSPLSSLAATIVDESSLHASPAPSPSQDILLPPPPPLQPIVVKNSEMTSGNSRSLVGGVTTWLPHNATIRLNCGTENGNCGTGGGGDGNGEDASLRRSYESPRPQYVEYLAGRKFLVVPKHNVVSVSSPTEAATLPAPLLSLMAQRTQAVKNEPESPFIDDSGAETGANGGGNRFGVGGGRNDMDFERTESPRNKKRVNTRTSAAAAAAGEKRLESNEIRQIENTYHQNLCFGYKTLLHVFHYLKVQDLLRASCVCTMWRDIANNPSLWDVVRMKNSQVHSFQGLANTLEKHGTKHLDFRKMLLPSGDDDNIWPEFNKTICNVKSLRRIELCRCPITVVEQLAQTNKDLETINATILKGEKISMDHFVGMKNLRDLRLKSATGLVLTHDIISLKELKNLKHLSLTSVKELNKKSLEVIAELVNLESLDLGECTDFPEDFGANILSKLVHLEKLRLEKGQGSCPTFKILKAVKDMPKLEQLELVNFDIKSGFDVALGACHNIRKLLIIPTYISQSATTNHMVLGGLLRLQSTLSHFVWGVTLELLRVTELFIDQCGDDGEGKRDRKDKKSTGGDSIPVLKPVPLLPANNEEIPPAQEPPQVEILSLPNLQKLLLQSLPTTRVKILKIPFHATWRQSITDMVN